MLRSKGDGTWNCYLPVEEGGDRKQEREESTGGGKAQPLTVEEFLLSLDQADLNQEGEKDRKPGNRVNGLEELLNVERVEIPVQSENKIEEGVR
jgi:hypothetical protein